MPSPPAALPTFPGDNARFAPGAGPVPSTLSEAARCIVVAEGDARLCDPTGAVLLPPSALEGLALTALHRLGTLDGVEVFATGLEGPSLPAETPLRPVGLRALAATLEAPVWAAAALAGQVMHWDRTTRFCGLCGATATVPDLAQRAKVCTACGHSVWPRIAPCVIALVLDDAGRMLLTRKAEWPTGRYGLVAGFVEPGETLEQCVVRECREETGVAVEAVTYRGSQPWPFPHQLMVGFRARAVSTEVTAGDGELEDARWFARDALPQLPPRLSIARALIDEYLAETTTV